MEFDHLVFFATLGYVLIPTTEAEEEEYVLDLRLTIRGELSQAGGVKLEVAKADRAKEDSMEVVYIDNYNVPLHL